MMDIKEVLLRWSIIFFDNETSGSVNKDEKMPDQQLA